MISVVILIFILSTFSFALFGNIYIKKKYVVKRRIQQFIPKDSQTLLNQTDYTNKERKKRIQTEIVKNVAKMIRTSKQKNERIERDLESAGVPLKVEEFLAIRVITFGIIFILALIVLDFNLIMSIAIAFIGWNIPSVVIKRKKETRITAGAMQLPQALETMSNGMKSGFSFIQAMQLVGKELPDPIGTEFTRTIKDMNIGISLEKAFENLLERLPNKDLEIVVTAVLIQRTTGGNLVPILETMNETISERVRMKDELRALTAQGRISALIITLLPVVLGLMLSIMNPDYFDPMFSHPLGLVMMGAGVLFGIIGWILINKVVTIEV